MRDVAKGAIALLTVAAIISGLFLIVELRQKDSGGDYSHLWYVSGSVLTVDASGGFAISIDSDDMHDNEPDCLTILVDPDRTRYISDKPVNVGSRVKVGYFLDSRNGDVIRCSSVEVLQ